MGLEISLLSFIPFIINRNKTRSESIIKYFIIQRVASTMFLFRVIYILIGVNIINEIILTISILIKLGAAPFHNWVLIIIERINYFTIFTLLTVLKVPPLTILYNINRKILTIAILLRIIIRSIACLNQTSIRKTIGYSSIYNIRLILISINKFNILITFITIYSSYIFLLTMIIKIIKINFINQLVFNEFNPWLKINLWLNILSIRGFPLTIGFMAKLLIIQTLIRDKRIITMIIIILTSMLVMIFYTRLAFTSIIISQSFKKWTLSKNKPLLFLITINVSITPIIITLIRIL